MRHSVARGFRLPALLLTLAVSAGLAAPVAHADGVFDAPVVTSGEYPASAPGGGIGVLGAFELDAVQANENDTVKFVYSFGARTLDREVAADAGGRATIRWTPDQAGTQSLYVRSVHRSGVISPERNHEIWVLPGGPAAAHWTLDQTFADTDGGNVLTPSGSPNTDVLGYGKRAIAFAAAGDHLGGASPIDTSKNFTVTAWAKVGAGARGVVALDDSAGLYHDAALGRWAFGMTAAADRTTPVVALSQNAAELDTWTHLTGTYETSRQVLGLHVDGVKQAEVTGVEAWQASRVLVGANLWGSPGVAGDRTIDEVKVFPRTLNEAEIRRQASEAGLRSHHRFSEGSGSVRDDVRGVSSPLGSGVEWETDGENTSLLFDGTGGVATNGPSIRTDRSFTISAWVRLDVDTLDGTKRSAVSLVHDDGAVVDIRYGGASKKWEVSVGGTTVETAHRAEPQEWTYLTVVHDELNGEIRFHLNGIYVTKAPASGGSPETDTYLEFAQSSAVGKYWKGGIDDVRAYAGVLTEQQITAQAVRV